MTLEHCKSCKYYQETNIFELCKHERSVYQIAEKSDFHTIGHMRKFSCGEPAVLFQQK